MPNPPHTPRPQPLQVPGKPRRHLSLHVRRGTERDRGSVSVWAAMITAAVFLLVGVAVDLGGRIQVLQQARDVAAQAARAGTQQLTDHAVLGQTRTVDPATAVTAARQYLNAAGAAGTVAVDGDTVSVTVTATYPTQFLGIIGIGSMTVHGTGTARLVPAINGTAP